MCGPAAGPALLEEARYIAAGADAFRHLSRQGIDATMRRIAEVLSAECGVKEVDLRSPEASSHSLDSGSASGEELAPGADCSAARTAEGDLAVGAEFFDIFELKSDASIQTPAGFSAPSLSS